MDRRDFIKAMGLGACCLAGQGALADTKNAKPNIIYILADDLGYGDVKALNPEGKIPTPNMDRLAAQGMTFTDAHSGSAVCTPTRYGILTGRYCWRSTLKSGVLWGCSPALIEKDRMTPASLLKEQGYRTACVGKWHLGLDYSTTDGKEATEKNIDYSKPITHTPCTLGFDYFFGIPASLDMQPYFYVENDRYVEAPTSTVERSQGKAFYRAGPCAPNFKHEEVLPKLTEKSVEVIDRHARLRDNSSLFLYFPLPAPHTPILPTPEFQGKTAAGPYGDFVHQVDWTIGQVMEALERNNMVDNTLIIVTSDNGCSPMANFKELEKMGHDPSYHFRGTKADIFEGGHRIPFIARWPEAIEAGSSYDHPICLTDLLATTAEMTGVSLPANAGEDSVSILPALTGKKREAIRETVVHHSIEGYFALRKGNWKLEFCPGSGGWSQPKEKDARKKGLPGVQLYDLSVDIAEKNNVYEKHPEVVAELTALMEKYIEEGRSTPGPKQSNEGETLMWGLKGKAKS